MAQTTPPGGSDPGKYEIDRTQPSRTDTRQAEMDKGRTQGPTTSDGSKPAPGRTAGETGTQQDADQDRVNAGTKVPKGIDDAVAEGVDQAREGRIQTPDTVNKPL